MTLRSIAAALLIASSAAAFSAESQPSSMLVASSATLARIAEQDRAVSEFYEALAQARLASERREQAAQPVLTLYLAAPDHLLHALTWSTDDGPANRLETADLEAALPITGAALRALPRLLLNGGSHHLHVEAELVGKGDVPGQVLVADRDFEFGANGLVEAEIVLTDRKLLSPELAIRRLVPVSSTGGLVDSLAHRIEALTSADTSYRPGGDQDPKVRGALYREASGDLDDALITLLTINYGARRDGTLDFRLRLGLARLLRKLGVAARAEQWLDSLDPLKLFTREVAVERLSLAQLRLSRGELDACETLLSKSWKPLPDFRQPDWRRIDGELKIRRGQWSDAATALGERSSDSIEAFRYMDSAEEAVLQNAYRRYNLAVSMIRSGRDVIGLSWLDLIGRSIDHNPEMQALSDRANLKLGWEFLKRKQGRTALGVFGRIRSDGPSASAAMLGIGWAQLAPNGDRLVRAKIAPTDLMAAEKRDDLPAPMRNSLTRLRVLEPEENGKRGPSSFSQDDPPKDRTEGLHRALSIWEILLDGDVRDPEAALEARLATGYAHDQLGEAAAARAAYEQAIADLEGRATALDQHARDVAAGELTKALAEAGSEGDALKAIGRFSLVPGDSSAPLDQMAIAYRDDLRRQRLLDAEALRVRGLGFDVDSTELTRLANAEAVLKARVVKEAALLRATAGGVIEVERKQINGYLLNARLMMARVQDQPDVRDRKTSQCEPECAAPQPTPTELPLVLPKVRTEPVVAAPPPPIAVTPPAVEPPAAEVAPAAAQPVEAAPAAAGTAPE